MLSPPGHHPVPIPSENPNKLAPFGTLNPGANFRTEATLSTRQKSLSPPPVRFSFHASSVGQSSASAASPGCHLLAKERNELGPVGVDCGHRGCQLQLQKDPGSIQDRSLLRGPRTPRLWWAAFAPSLPTQQWHQRRQGSISPLVATPFQPFRLCCPRFAFRCSNSCMFHVCVLEGIITLALCFCSVYFLVIM